MHAAIIAGGQGTRAIGMTAGSIPKALLPVGGVPIIFRQMRVLRREGISRLSVLAGHLGDRLVPALEAEADALGLPINVIVEPTPLGTAGCLANLGPEREDCLLVYGDMLFDVAVARLREFHANKRALLTIVAHPNDHPKTSDLIAESEGIVHAVLPYGQPRENDHRNLVPAGLYLASPEFFERVERGTKTDLIRDLIPALLNSGARVAVYNTPEYLRDIGTPARHAVAERDLAAGRVERSNLSHRRPAIFFDCDGVLNEEPGLHGAIKPEDVRVVPGAGTAVKRARDAGRLVIGITNRPQVAKGLVTHSELARILGRLEALLAADGGVLDRIYYCPHHPEAGFPGEVSELKISCECRKPGTLMLRRALADTPFDQRRSALIGDSLRDIGAARAFGIWAYGVRTGAGCRDGKRYREEFGTPPAPDLMFENVNEAVQFNIEYGSLAAPVVATIHAPLDQGRSPALIGVCGRSRAGKSVVAHAIVRSLMEADVSCLRVRLDDWIVPAPGRLPGISAETRARAQALPELVQALRSGVRVTAPGYDAASRGISEPVIYDPAGCHAIVIEGSFGGHEFIRDMLDFVVFVSVPEALQRARFAAFYRWKGLEERTIDALWHSRSLDEWPAVDAQRSSANLVIVSEANP